MTLVAAYRVGSVPFLISDFLVTADGEERSLEVPAFPNFRLTSGLSAFHVVQLRRKSFRVWDDLIVAGCDSVAGIAKIFSRLGAHRWPRRDLPSLKEFFERQSLNPFENCTIVGHLLAAPDNLITFRWHSTTGAFDTGECFTEGSGVGLFSDVVPSVNFGAIRSEEQLEGAIESALHVTTTLYANEARSGNTLEQRMGGGYDIYTNVGRGFEPVKRVTYLFYACEVRDRNTMRFFSTPLLVQHRLFDQVAFIRVAGGNAMLHPGTDADERVALAFPLHARKRIPLRDVALDSIPYTSPRYAIGMIGRTSSGEQEVFTTIVSREEAKQFKIYRTGLMQGSLTEVRFELPDMIMNNIAKTAGQRFLRLVPTRPENA